MNATFLLSKVSVGPPNTHTTTPNSSFTMPKLTFAKKKVIAFLLLRRRRRARRIAHKRMKKKTRGQNDPLRIKSNRLLNQMMLWKDKDDHWIQQVGMTFPTFQLLVKKIHRNGDLHFRSGEASSMEKLITVLNLFRFGKQQRDSSLSVGSSHGSIGNWINQVLKALLKLTDELISLPVTDEELKDVAEGFSRFKRSRMVQCVGAIDGTHIRIRSSDLAMRNRKGWDSINCQVICDHMFYIRHVVSQRQRKLIGFKYTRLF